MIVRDYTPSHKNDKMKKDIIRIKITSPTNRKQAGKVTINSLHAKSKHNVKVTLGVYDLRKMIEQYDKELLKLRK